MAQMQILAPKKSNASKLGEAIKNAVMVMAQNKQEKENKATEAEQTKQSDIRQAILKGITSGTLQSSINPADILKKNLGFEDEPLMQLLSNMKQVPKQSAPKKMTKADLKQIKEMQSIPNVNGYSPLEMAYMNQFQGLGKSIPIDYTMKGGTGIAELIEQYNNTDDEEEKMQLEELLSELLKNTDYDIDFE